MLNVLIKTATTITIGKLMIPVPKSTAPPTRKGQPVTVKTVFGWEYVDLFSKKPAKNDRQPMI